MESLLLIFAAVVFVYALVSAVVPSAVVTGPMVFVAVGMMLSRFTAGILEAETGEVLEVIAELTLVILLFTDASRIDVRSLRRELGFPVRLLGIGLPLTILLGTVVGKWLLPEFSWWEVALLSAILAPTDAALGQAVVSSPLVPVRIRQTLNVESGLNDGIAVPFVMLFASFAAIRPESASVSHWVTFWLMQVTLGPLTGVVVGLVGGRLIEAAADRGWVTESFMKLSGIAFAILAWAGAGAIGGNGFIAAFVCGMTIGWSTMAVKTFLQEFGETEGQMLSLAAFLLFGATLVVPALHNATATDWFYAALSLTVVRMLPVALSLVGSSVKFSTVGFLGWFGPRGLASLIFALLVTREHEFPHGDQLLTIAMLTATLSIVLHGITAVPGAKWYAKAINTSKCREGCEHEPVVQHALRHSCQAMVMPSDESPVDS